MLSTASAADPAADAAAAGGSKHVDLSSRIHYRRCLDTVRREERRRARRRARDQPSAGAGEVDDGAQASDEMQGGHADESVEA
eukprot:3394466-Prymnesium_polylepis.1